MADRRDMKVVKGGNVVQLAQSSEAASTLPATAQDATRAAALPAAPVKRDRVTSAFVDLLSGPETRSTLHALSAELKHFEGCDVESAMGLVDEAVALIGVVTRLENSAARVRQRVVEINAKLKGFETGIARAQKSAAAGSDVATKLEPMVGRRARALGTSKAVATRRSNKKTTKKPGA